MTRRHYFWAALLAGTLGMGVGCSSAPKNSESARYPASAISCESFNALSAEEKLQVIMNRHLESAGQDATLLNGDADSAYVAKFVGGFLQQAAYDGQALLATSKFLSPSVPHLKLGFKALEPSFTRDCDFFDKPTVKMVHALGTLASAHMVVYSKLRSDDLAHEELGENPWTGLLSPTANGGSVPLIVRFSIANPMGSTIKVAGKDLLLEFIPGLGLKFLIDGQKSVDLLAMESLAGQGSDQDFFRYDFSPDFSGHAPPAFITSSGEDRAEILSRYAENPVNEHVMGLVGKRFWQVIPAIYPAYAKELNPHSNIGPHPFIISIQGLASLDRTGKAVPVSQQKRPWRLVFEPALDNIPATRLKAIIDPTPFAHEKIETDFRAKLAHLRPGDRVYYVVAESRSGNRSILGEIDLDSVPFPSEFADREFFIQHALETSRVPENSGTILDFE